MPQFNPRRSTPFRSEGSGLTEERAPAGPVTPPAFRNSLGIVAPGSVNTPLHGIAQASPAPIVSAEYMSGRFPNYQEQGIRNLPGVINTGELMPDPSSPSLITALQATLDRGRVGRKLVVIPGSGRKRASAMSLTGALPGQLKPLNPRLQLGFLLVAATFFLSLSLLSVTSVGHGQGSTEALQKAISLFESRTAGGMTAIEMQQAAQQAAQQAQQADIEVSSSDYVTVARTAAANCGIDPDIFVRQIQQESGFNPNAVSPVGAVGIAQFMPATAAELGIDPWDPVQALKGAACHMASMSQSYGGNYAMALAAYNAGSGNLEIAMNNCGDAWLSCMPAETQNYVAKIMGW
jgi:hypothetical protein